MMRILLLLGSFLGLLAVKPAFAVDPYAGMDPYWVVIHEPVVQKELGLTAKQKTDYLSRLDELDMKFFPLRNQNDKVAIDGLAKLTTDARRALGVILDAKQTARIDAIVLRKTGAHGLLRPELKSRMNYSADQEKKIVETIEATQKKVAILEKRLQSAGDKTIVNKEFRELKTKEQAALIELLTPGQRSEWQKAVGESFDLTLLGSPAMKAPDFVDSGVWVNGNPGSLKSMRGQVVVVHFYAFQCHNCHANFPWYKSWHKDFSGNGVMIVGIHTPETETERSSDNVLASAKEAGFAFPVLVDGQSRNWNAWGNSMWPSVYLIDKRGYVRQFWPGELNWQGGKGEEFMRRQIEQLLAEETD